MDNYKSIWKYLFRTPHRLNWVDVKGVSTRYLEAGKPGAPVLILLHGTAGSLENFCANYAAYAEHFHVFGIDMLGCGATDKPDYDYLIEHYAEHVRGFMDALQIASASLIGVSLGSWVAAQLAHSAPARVDKLIMVAPAGIIVDAEEERRVAEGVRKRRSAAATTPTWDTVRTAMSGLMLKPEDLIDDLIAIRLDIYQDPRMQAAMPHLLAFSLGGQDLKPAQWRELKQPILSIAAVDAPNMFLRNAYAIGVTAPNAQVVDMHGCDHWAQFEQAERFNQLSIEFLQAQA
jgi:2-hydroxy-6-oxonona-2,4-dienedioate hydrolase